MIDNTIANIVQKNLLIVQRWSGIVVHIQVTNIDGLKYFLLYFILTLLLKNHCNLLF